MPPTSEPERRPQVDEREPSPSQSPDQTEPDQTEPTTGPAETLHSGAVLLTHMDARAAAHAFDQREADQGIERLIMEWRPQLYAALRRRDAALSAEDIEDLIQETARKAVTAATPYDPARGPVLPWLRKIAEHARRDHWDRNKKRRNDRSLNRPIGPDGDEEEADRLEATTRSPEEFVIDSLRRENLRDAFIAELTPGQAQEFAAAYDGAHGSDGASKTPAERRALFRARRGTWRIMGLSDEAGRAATLWRKLDGSGGGIGAALTGYLGALPADDRVAEHARLCSNLKAARRVLHDQLGIDINVDAVLTFDPHLVTTTEED